MNNFLTPLQAAFLRAFFTAPIGRRFFLTGGPALAAFYLHHRLSDDLDLFTLDDAALEASARPVEEIVTSLGCVLQRTRVTQYYHQLLLTHPHQATSLKVALVRDFGPQYGEKSVQGEIIVDSLDNIAANKIAAIFGRADMKDFVDLYFILQAGYDFDDLFARAREKDTGLTEFYFVGMLRQIERLTQMPKMIRPLDLEMLRSFYADLARRLVSRLNPEKRTGS